MHEYFAKKKKKKNVKEEKKLEVEKWVMANWEADNGNMERHNVILLREKGDWKIERDQERGGEWER